MQHRGDQENFKSGFVGIVGPPNAGKSTLLNRMLGEKISITSKKPQTTRNRILGVLHRPSGQLVFIDTPGVHRARSELNVRLVDVALSSFSDVDLILAVIDASTPAPSSEAILIDHLMKFGGTVLLALNKADLLKKDRILPLIHTWSSRFGFRNIVPISARHGTQVDVLIDAMESALPLGPAYFPQDALTDMPERFLAAEMIREKVFRYTGQEIPYSSAVTVDAFSEQQTGGLVRIDACIHVERESQKAIVIGKKGLMLKKIGEAARKEIQGMVGAKVFLRLFVRVQKNWSKDTKALRRLGY